MDGHRGRHRARTERPGTSKPYSLTAWPDDSLGRLSCLLSRYFGGTPWEWREKASEFDWATAVEILQDETERMEENDGS
ncbi:hypothetical protein DXC54_05565 [Bifidobacterium longum]|uniref:Uncharacterized protein n=1 Tax=Bifidobacterium longum TaxID=216816 RepID=A0A3E4S769_BIFLN|nr:hypothetical protein DXC63_03430 [Bifidobacterium longum]RGL65594.1 hypothetical protein DXC54_05565 [Bifidobacterium longum]